MQLSALKGIGPKTEALFQKLGIRSAEDLISYYPVDYLSFQAPVPVQSLKEGDNCAVTGYIEKDASLVRINGMEIVSCYIRDMTGRIRLNWFRSAFMKNTLKAGSRFVFSGRVTTYRNQLTINQPKLYRVEEYAGMVGTLEPVYGRTAGLSNALIRKAVQQAFQHCRPEPECLPPEILANRRLPDHADAVFGIHFPKDAETLERSRQRLAYEEFFLFSLAMQRKKRNTAGVPSAFQIPQAEETDKLLRSLPFTLTKGQQSAIADIRRDLSGGMIMNRLVQGDVGSGKTMVAAAALIDTVTAGFQAAFMAPTELLAEQHHAKLTALIDSCGLNIKTVLLTGGLKKKERTEALQMISSGEAGIVVGTHALFQEAVVYHALALVITDEQHRFGVQQRQSLAEKGREPHILAMSATPIPRTLAMLVYADMEVSRIPERPAERLPIKNAVVSEAYRERSYRFIREEVEKGRQAYVICPMVEENEDMDAEDVISYTDKLRVIFPKELKTAYLHGQMKPQEKEDVMSRFASGEIQVLVSTTVVEVGVDVPNATVMMVENAERFGLSQLHQLRGRVGRGKHQSYCIFVDTKQSETSKKRLEVLRNSNDGFRIAEEDLRLRGPGDILGVRQSGALCFSVGDIYRDGELLSAASEDAAYICRTDPELEAPEHAALHMKMDQYITESFIL